MYLATVLVLGEAINPNLIASSWIRLWPLCSRHGVDRSRRTQHGALLDAELLAAVYVELTTTRQAALQLESIRLEPSNIKTITRVRPNPLPPRVTADDRNAHRAFVATLGSEAIWRDYFEGWASAA
jgi:DNA polymerase III subunit epsilon